MSAGLICSRVVATATPNETVRTVAQRMAEVDVGSLVVVGADEPHPVLGVVTDRDIAVRVVATALDADSVPVSQIMTVPPQCVDETTPIPEALARMAAVVARRLVVTGDEGRMVGILSVDDVLVRLTDEIWSVGRLLSKQQPAFL